MKKKILIVEDEVLIAMQLKLVLLRTGYEICGVVADAEKAIECAKATQPDVILIDIGLASTMDGIECARQIRAFSSAQIIFTTGFEDPQLMERAMELKPAAYLVKPIQMHDIKKAVEVPTCKQVE